MFAIGDAGARRAAHEESGLHAESDVCLFVMSIGASASGGALGMAGGIFIVPFLTLFEGVSLQSAVACSIVSVIACSCASAAPFLRCGLTNIRVAIFARGDIDPAIAGPVALELVIGSVFGLLAVSGDRLRLLFVIVALAAQCCTRRFRAIRRVT